MTRRYSFSGGYTRHVYICEKRYKQDRDVYRPCTKKDDPKFRMLSNSKPKKGGVSFVVSLRRDYGVQEMNKEYIGQWFPLCGCKLEHELQIVGYDILQLILVCFLTSFCAMPRNTRNCFNCKADAPEIGALILLFVFSLSLFFVGDERGGLIAYIKCTISIGLGGRIMYLICTTDREGTTEPTL